MAWRRDDIRARVEARAAELNRSLSSVAGYPTFFAPGNAEKPPRIDTLERMADALDWPLCRLLCDTPSHVELQESVLADALETATKALPSGEPGARAPMVKKLYALLIERRRQGLPVTKDYLDGLVDVNRE